MNRPNENSYWVLPGKLLAGEYPGAKDPDVTRARLQDCLKCGVTFFLDLTESHELLPYAQLLEKEAALLNRSVQYQRLPIRDVSVPATKEYAGEILVRIDTALNAGHTVYVHCWGGVGRTGTIIGCWLVRHGMTGEQALAQLAEWWSTVKKFDRKPHCPETHEQREYVRTWAEPLTK